MFNFKNMFFFSIPVLSILLLFFVSAARCLIVDDEIYYHCTGELGPAPGQYNITGELIVAEPQTFCKGSEMPSAEGKIIVVLRSLPKTDCYFFDKAKAAQLAKTNAAGIIIGNNVAQRLFKMGRINDESINIPTILVMYETYEILVSKIRKSTTIATLNEIGEVSYGENINIPYYLFAMLCGVSGLFTCHVIKRIYRQFQNRLMRINGTVRFDDVSWSPESSQSRVSIGPPPVSLVKTERAQHSLNDSCAICLEDFDPDEQINYLPCHHGFHSQCLLPWLDRSDLCPICKSSVMKI